MRWSDRVAGTGRRRAAHDVGNNGGGGSWPVRSPQIAARPDGWRTVDRRGLLKFAGTAALAAPAAGLLTACGGGDSAGAGTRAVRIGLVSPRTGGLRAYSEIDDYVVETMNTVFQQGIRVGGSTLPAQIFVRDGQTDRNRAAGAAGDLIFTDNVDLVLVGGTADNVNPVSDICEANGVPCISTQAPWESWFYGRGGNLQTPFSWTYHFFWGMADLARVYAALWQQLGVSRRVGLLLPGDLDGRAFAQYAAPLLQQAGFDLGDLNQVPFYTAGERVFGDQLQEMKRRNVSIVTGIPNVEDFAAFWKRASDENQIPDVLTASKALIFQADVQAIGTTADGFTTEVAWSPVHPFRSSLTNAPAQKLADDYESKMGRGWAQPLGFTHALFEVAVQALAAVDSIDDPRGIADAISRVTARTIVGTVAFGSTRDLPKNVARIDLVGGQWQRGTESYDLKVVNSNGTNVPAEQLRATQQN